MEQFVDYTAHWEGKYEGTKIAIAIDSANKVTTKEAREVNLIEQVAPGRYKIVTEDNHTHIGLALISSINNKIVNQLLVSGIGYTIIYTATSKGTFVTSYNSTITFVGNATIQKAESEFVHMRRFA